MKKVSVKIRVSPEYEENIFGSFYLMDVVTYIQSKRFSQPNWARHAKSDAEL